MSMSLKREHKTCYQIPLSICIYVNLVLFTQKNTFILHKRTYLFCTKELFILHKRTYLFDAKEHIHLTQKNIFILHKRTYLFQNQNYAIDNLCMDYINSFSSDLIILCRTEFDVVIVDIQLSKILCLYECFRF